MKSSPKSATVGRKIVDRLRGFTEALERGEQITEKFTCRKIELAIASKPYGPEDAKEARRVLNMSQAIFARFIGVSVGTVRAWEQGVNHPEPLACRFMDEIRHDPEYWHNRVKQLARERHTSNGTM